MAQIASLVIVFVLFYLGSVFFVPGLSDRVDSLVGLDGLSDGIRSAKEHLDSLGAPTSSTGSVAETATGGLVDRARAGVEQARALYETTQARVVESREFIDRKSSEFQELMESMRQAKEIADKLQKDLDTFTTLGATGSTDTEADLRSLEANLESIRSLSGAASATGSLH